MNKTTLKRSTGLKATKKLNKISKRRVAQLNSEVVDRLLLCKQAHGKPEIRRTNIRINSEVLVLESVLCRDGICADCGKQMPVIEPHEYPPRSLGGKVGKDSRMLDRLCHIKAQGENR